MKSHLGQLRDPDWVVRVRAIKGLTEGWATIPPTREPDPAAFEPLLAIADDPVKNVRNAVAEALWLLARSEKGEARDRIRTALSDKSWRVRFGQYREYG